MGLPGGPRKDVMDSDAVRLGKEVGGEGMGLVHALVTASMDSSFKTMDTLYEREREHRMALQMHIENTLDKFEMAHMGTVREYEECVRMLSFVPTGERIRSLAAQHPENDHA